MTPTSIVSSTRLLLTAVVPHVIEIDGYPGVSMVRALEKRKIAFTGSDSGKISEHKKNNPSASQRGMAQTALD